MDFLNLPLRDRAIALFPDRNQAADRFSFWMKNCVSITQARRFEESVFPTDPEPKKIETEKELIDAVRKIAHDLFKTDYSDADQMNLLISELLDIILEFDKKNLIASSDYQFGGDQSE